MPLLFEDTEPLTYENFESRRHYQVFLYGKGMDIGGGTITREEIDILKDYPELERISIAGLHQDTFDYFVNTYGSQFKAIYFFKNKLVSDLSALGKLENVEILAYFLNQRAEKLWNMENNKKLRMLNIDDFSRLHDLTGVETAPALECLTFGNKVWATSKMQRIPDLSNSRLKKINYNAEVGYEDAYNLLKIEGLECLDFRRNLYRTEFLAWICANYPMLEGYSLKPYILFDDNSGFICGKRKPYFCDINEEKVQKKVQNAVDKFERMKKQYKGKSFEEIMDIINAL